MGIGSFFKKLGKGALKVGKFAAVPALAATGVGIPAAIALGAGLSAADKKASGGSWKQALTAGAIGGATSAIPGLGGVGNLAKGGLSLPGGIAASAGGEALGGVAKAGIGSAIKGAAMNAGKQMLTSGALDALGPAAGAASQAAASNRGTKAEIMMDQNEALERQLLAREVEKRAAQRQAFNGAMIGERTTSWNPLVRPRGVPGSYVGPTAASRGVGAELYNQAMNRLKSSDLTGPQGMPAYRNLATDKDFGKTMNASGWEKAGGIASWLSPLLNGALSGKQIGQPKPTTPPVIDPLNPPGV